MAHFAKLRGIGTSQEAEICYLTGYNGVAAAVSAGTPVCWDATASDGITFALPAATNMRLAAGIAVDAVASGGYTSKIVAYGPCTARTYGIATTFVAGCGLVLVSAKTYLAYGTDGELTVQVPQAFTALQDNATTDTVTTKVFVRAL